MTREVGSARAGSGSAERVSSVGVEASTGLEEGLEAGVLQEDLVGAIDRFRRVVKSSKWSLSKKSAK